MGVNMVIFDLTKLVMAHITAGECPHSNNRIKMKGSIKPKTKNNFVFDFFLAKKYNQTHSLHLKK